MGARPLRRAIQRYIEDPLADFVLRAELVPGATVMVDPAPEGDERKVLLTVVEPKPAPTPVGVGAEGGGDEGEQASAGEPAEPAASPDALGAFRRIARSSAGDGRPGRPRTHAVPQLTRTACP